MKLRLSFRSLFGIALLFSCAQPLCAATFNIANGDVAGLKSAITTANSNGQDDTIELAANGTYTLVAKDSLLNGLPQIAPDGGHKLTIHGNGATIQRSNAAENFRIFYISSGANLTLSGLTIANGNPGAIHGGAIYNDGENADATLTITNCTITGNSGDYGGAIFNDGFNAAATATTASLTVINSTISGNSASQYGGGIWSDGSFGRTILNVSNCTFSQNSASISAGAIQHDGFMGSATGSIINCTFSQNSAGQYGGGVNIDGESGTATLSISDCTFSGNTAGTGGGGIYNSVGAGGTAVLQIDNTIFKSGASGGNIVNNGGTISSQGFNLSNDAAGGDGLTGPGGVLNHTGDKRNTDPLLDSAGLQDNGGPTKTIALQPSSPAINMGDPAAPPRDQRGYVRQDAPDIGAFEFGATIPVTLTNLSTRGSVGTGDNVMIGGFVITGSGTRSVLVRAIGPSLSNPPSNLTNVLQDPTLSLFDSTPTKIAFNDNWADAANASAIPLSLRPTSSLESAILIMLNPGAYTAIVSGVSGGTGLALAEIYDLGGSVASKLANISTRGLVGTGDNVLIGGFVVQGPDSENLVVRAIGPSLSNPPFNIANALQNPTLSLFDVNGTQIASNDDWRSTQQTAIITTGLQPSNNLESAILITLIPGSYTAIVSGVGGTTGVGLVEIYGLN